MQNDTTTFAARGKRVKISGIIVSREPDTDAGQDDRTEPRYFVLEAETHPQDTIPSSVNLDIESLNRYERQFIIDHCYALVVTPCRAAVLGKVDEIVGRRSLGLTYLGIVADQIDIKALDWSCANPNGLLSDRTILEISGKASAAQKHLP